MTRDIVLERPLLGRAAQHPFEAELGVAANVAHVAGRTVMRYFGEVDAASGEANPHAAEAVRAAEALIRKGLAAAFPEDALLTEGSGDGAARLGAERVWVVDPLNGVREFGEGLDEFSVLMALVVAGEPVVGVVALPGTGELYSAAREAGAWLYRSGSAVPVRRPPADPGRMRMVISRSRADTMCRLETIRLTIGAAAMRRCGSAGLKAVLVARGEADIYVHPGPGLNEWDTCAGDLLVREAGGSVTDCLGSPIRYNKAEVRHDNGVVVAGPGTPATILERVTRIWRSRSLSNDSENGA